MDANAGDAAGGTADALPEELRAELLQFLGTGDREVVNALGHGSSEAGATVHGAASDHDAGIEAAIAARELEQLPEDAAGAAMRLRIEHLMGLSARLEKHLAERAQSRHGQLMAASTNITQASALQSLCERHFPQLRSSFDAYLKASLHNAMSLPRMAQRLNALRKLHSVLLRMQELRVYRDALRRHDMCSRRRIVTAAVAVQAVEGLLDSQPGLARIAVVQSLREGFKGRLHSLVKNTAMKLDSGFNLAASVRLFHLLGLSAEAAALRIMAGLRQQMFGVTLSAVKRYVNVDPAAPHHSAANAAAASSAGADGAGPGGQGGGRGAPRATSPKTSQSDMTRYTRMLGPNMILLTVCKILSEITGVFESVAAALEGSATTVTEEPLPPDIRPPSGQPSYAHLPDNVLHCIRELDERGAHDFRIRVLDVVRRDFDRLRGYACSLLAALLGEINISAVKDRNDYLKVALLLRFFLESQAQCMAYPQAAAAAANSAPKTTPIPAALRPTAAATDDAAAPCADIQEADHVPVADVRKVLQSAGVAALGAPTADEHNDERAEAQRNIEALEDVIHARLIAPYVEFLYAETLEKLAMAFSGDSFQRLAAPVGGVHEHCDIFELSELFRTRAAASMRRRGGLAVCSLNPYNGWTPSSAFLGVNIESWPQRQQAPPPAAIGAASRNGVPASCKREDHGAAPASTSSKAPTLTQEEWLDLYRNFGCVFTSSSFALWSQLAAMFRVVALQPAMAPGHVVRVLAAYDWLLARNIQACQVPLELQDLPHLRDFMAAYGHLEPEERPETARQSGISMLARLVNTVESVATLLELLRSRLDFGCVRCARVLAEHHGRRMPVVEELRLAVYPMCMLSLLQKRLPGEAIAQLLQLKHVTVTAAGGEIGRLMAAFATHLDHVRGFIEAADCGSIPLPVKVLLWRYACLVVKSAMQPLLELVEQQRVPDAIRTAARDGYERARARCAEILRHYRAAATTDCPRQRQAVAHLAVYETMIQEIRNERF